MPSLETGEGGCFANGGALLPLMCSRRYHLAVASTVAGLTPVVCQMGFSDASPLPSFLCCRYSFALNLSGILLSLQSDNQEYDASANFKRARSGRLSCATCSQRCSCLMRLYNTSAFGSFNNHRVDRCDQDLSCPDRLHPHADSCGVLPFKSHYTPPSP